MTVAEGTPTAEHSGDGQHEVMLLTVEEAARRLQFGRTFVYRLISSGELESVTIGRMRRVPAQCLAEYVATLRRAGNSGAAGGSSAA